MNTAVAEKPSSSLTAIQRSTVGESIFLVNDAGALSIRAVTEFAFTNGMVGFDKDFPIALPELVVGADYYVRIDSANEPVAFMADGLPPADAIGGFHYAPGGNAPARAGGDDRPAINPSSCWDAGFRPACPDPRGMALVDRDGLLFWCDIYLLGVDHMAKGTSRFGEIIADGDDLPAAVDGKVLSGRCDFPTVQAIYAHHDKQLLTYDEFRAAAFGVTEKSAAEDAPGTTGLDAARTSRFGIMQATGNMWVWGTDGDSDDSRPSVFGGSWVFRSSAGSRYAGLGYWPGSSSDNISARGRSDHLAA
jgi:hypothetical protein